MGPSKYVGRIGGLAAALGIGVAVFTAPAVAWADQDASPTGTESASSADTAPSRPDAPTRTRASAKSDAGSGATVRSRSGRSAESTSANDAPDTEAVAPRRNRGAAKNSDVPGPAAVTSNESPAVASAASTAPVSAPAAAIADAVPSVTVAPAASLPKPSVLLPTVIEKLAPLLPAKPVILPVQPAPNPGTALAKVADRITTAINTAVARIVDSLASGSPFGPKVESPANWLLLAVARRQLLPAASTNAVAQGTTAAPVMVLNGYDVVPTSKLDAVSFYGPYTTWPGYSGVQGTQDFDLVDPETGNTVGSFTAHVRQDTYTSTQVLQVVETHSGTVGTDPGQTPPVGSIISIAGQGRKVNSVYSTMPSADGFVTKYDWITPFFTVPLRTKYDAAYLLTDYISVNNPLDMLNGYYIAPHTPSTEEFTTIAGMPPTFTAVQGKQLYSVYDENGNRVGNFDGLVTTTSDFFGLDTKMIIVADTGSETNVGLGPGQIPPAGTVYNVIYFTDTRYVLYQSSPTPEGQYVATTLVLPRKNIPLTLGNMDASYPPPLIDFPVPSGNSMRPTTVGPIIGGNGLPPREMIAQSSAQYDVLDADGKKVGSFDSYLTRQWDWGGIWQDEILVINVNEGTVGTGAGEVPPVGTVYTRRMVGSTGFGELYISTPTANGPVSKHYWVTPFGYIPLAKPKNSAVDVNQVNFYNPFKP